MTPSLIKDLFASDIDRNIEEVIKVDQTDEEIIRDEIAEYVVTDSIRSHFTHDPRALRARRPNKPHEGIGVWVSGFFGSGKSSFAKNLGLALENRPIAGDGAAELLRRSASATTRCTVLLKTIARAHPDPRRHLRRLDRPRHPQRQPDAHRDHVPALPPEPRLRQGPRPLRARDHARGAGPARRVQGEVRASSSSKDWDAEKGLIAFAMQRGEPGHARARPGDVRRRPTSWRESASRTGPTSRRASSPSAARS